MCVHPGVAWADLWCSDALELEVATLFDALERAVAQAAAGSVSLRSPFEVACRAPRGANDPALAVMKRLKRALDPNDRFGVEIPGLPTNPLAGQAPTIRIVRNPLADPTILPAGPKADLATAEGAPTTPARSTASTAASASRSAPPIASPAARPPRPGAASISSAPRPMAASSPAPPTRRSSTIVWFAARARRSARAASTSGADGARARRCQETEAPRGLAGALERFCCVA